MVVLAKIKELFSPESGRLEPSIASSSNTNYRLRPLTAKQLDEVVLLSLRCFAAGEHYSRETFSHLLKSPDYLCYRSISDAEQMTGFILISISFGSIGHITTIGVAPEHRNRGIARRLLIHSEDSLRRRGIGSVVLEVREGNYIAQNLYDKLGYIVIQKLSAYYTNGENAFLMSKVL